MKTGTEFHEVVRVAMHLNGGFTRVVLEDGHHWDLPTDGVPMHLRAIGCRFIVHFKTPRPEPSDTADAIRLAVRDFVVEELTA